MNESEGTDWLVFFQATRRTTITNIAGILVHVEMERGDTLEIGRARLPDESVVYHLALAEVPLE